MCQATPIGDIQTTKCEMDGIEDGGDLDKRKTNPLQLLVWLVLWTAEA